MQFDQINIDLKIGILLSVIALVLSLVTGFVAGVSAGTVFLRAIIIAAVFFGVGFALVQVLKKFVPEVYEALSAPGPAMPDAGGNEQQYESAPDVEEQYGAENSEQQFTELTEQDFARYSTKEDADLNTTLNPAAGKMGKHVVQQQQFNSYEPKIMAQAVKTMMSRDKE